MTEEFNEIQDIKSLFEQVLGSEINIIDNLDGTKETVFILLVEKLEAAYQKESKLFADFGIDVSLFTDDLWFVIEGFFKMVYGEEATEIIYWYIFDRVNEKGETTAYQEADEEEEAIEINSAKELWDLIFGRKGLGT